MEPIEVVHTFPPIFDKNSRLLILGTVPSVKSREKDFYYGHPRNRFWPLLAFLCGEEPPETKEEKTKLLLRHGIALYDVVERCTITGSSDSSIRNVVPVDLRPILSQTGNIPIFVNGATAARLYKKFLYAQTGIAAVSLPSTSPANAAWTMERLREAWGAALLPFFEG
ncbi:DNA-deoxyinosine glycosylase [Anaerotignum lactatifermentans]|uniref:DNA-deoxyinosine glycosylase n=1 Tax=Anaerotignum lactatifermentans TaxID=160404 RepID=A0ABS2GA71_9FIRM|nr:DNA-deoxyinosine glycosylase [Anaerotignum lactatifermentans]MBM6829568.1 DNA-deoxyinosine glycosylase [Anaerotignum lactatifermentans]MBM6878062.1 DNA-deoxyinosine glycosylase [Anaerotignum lactatifermentans]MBM6951108.1 DNA-deoxyinosine glycosylase [Anaerotignum lactatifermentans]